MDSKIFFVKFENSDIKGTPEGHHQDEGKPRKCRGCRCLVLMTVCLGLICALLLVYIILLHITIKAERNQLKNTVEEFNQTINSLKDKHTKLMSEKDQLQNNFSSLNQKNLELETKVNNLTAEKKRLQDSFNSSSQKNLELETKVSNLTAEKTQLQRSVDFLSQKKLELETRVNNLTAEKKQLQDSFNSSSQKNLELETRVNSLTAEKTQLQRSVDSLSQKKLELEGKVTSLTDELQKVNDKGNRLGWFFITPESKSWSDTRQYCKDRGGDLIILNTEVKQRFIASFLKESVWIGLNDIQQEGSMKWVDASPLKQGFWYSGEPNDAWKNEDCVEMYASAPLQNWNDLSCTQSRRGICEK